MIIKIKVTIPSRHSSTKINIGFTAKSGFTSEQLKIINKHRIELLEKTLKLYPTTNIITKITQANS